MGIEEFNLDLMKPLLKLSSEKTLNKNVFNSINKTISSSEKIESIWSNLLACNPEDKDNYEIYHISRMVRCSLLGFRVKLKESIGTKDNPKILEDSTEFFKSIDSFWKNLKPNGHLILNISDIYTHHKIQKICDPMNDHIEKLSGAQYQGAIGMRMAKRPNSKASKDGIFCEPMWVWKKLEKSPNR